MLIRRHAGIAKRAEKDGIEFVAEHFDGARGQRNALAQVLVRAPIQIDEFERPPGASGHDFQYFDGLRGNFRPDAVAGYHCDSSRGPPLRKGMPGKVLPPRRRGFAPPENCLEKTTGLFAAAYPSTRYSSINAVCRASFTTFPGEAYRAAISLTTTPRPTRSKTRPSPLRPGVLFARLVCRCGPSVARIRCRD